ncbi:hypothetical protein ANAPH2_01263 [Anaplasma phagocytophilum]|nr:hypothetical protein ANAPH2_01263 [Anaplasma phagocytophilum]
MGRTDVKKDMRVNTGRRLSNSTTLEREKKRGENSLFSLYSLHCTTRAKQPQRSTKLFVVAHLDDRQIYVEQKVHHTPDCNPTLC